MKLYKDVNDVQNRNRYDQSGMLCITVSFLQLGVISYLDV